MRSRCDVGCTAEDPAPRVDVATEGLRSGVTEMEMRSQTKDMKMEWSSERRESFVPPQMRLSCE